MIEDPSLGAPHLLGRLHHGLPEPAAPVLLEIPGVREGAVLVREEQQVVAEDDEQVAHLVAFLPLAQAWSR